MDEEKGKSCLFLCFSSKSKPKSKKTVQKAAGCAIFVPKIIGKQFENIWAIVKDNSVYISIYGRIGVGKTTLLAYFNNQFLDQHSYDFVISVFRLRVLTSSSLLAEIATQIGLSHHPEWNQKPTNQKREAIFQLLSGKRYALLVDDFHFSNTSVFADIGLPYPNRTNQCKVVFAYELSHGSHDMCIRLDPLEWEDSWCLFKQQIGSQVDVLDDPEISSLAAKVALLCQGLPDALLRIGGLMKCNTSLQEWQNAFGILKKFDNYEPETTYVLDFPRTKFEDVAQILCDELGRDSMFQERVVAQTKPYDHDSLRKIGHDLRELKDALARLVTTDENYDQWRLKHLLDFVDGLNSYSCICDS